MTPPDRKDYSIDAVFDIETETWDKFLCGGVLHSDGAYQGFDFRNEDDYADHLLAIDGSLWSHNGGVFDMKWLLDHAIKRELKVAPQCAGSRIVAMRIGKLECYDSKALTKISLKELTKGMGVTKQATGIDCICGQDCGGYCAFSRKMTPAKLRRVMEYMEADCRSLMEAMVKVKAFCAENDLDMGATVGSSAWSCARRWLELPGADLSDNSHAFARQGYFGGRVQLFRPVAAHGFEADVNSMYPSRLAHFPLPVGEPSREFSESAARSFIGGRPGIYRARVSVPDMHLPPLPVRLPDGRISYPVGSFEGTWAAPELRHAESCGVRIDGVFEGLVWPREEIVFAPWVEKLFALRAGAPGGKKGPIGTFLKFYLNSLTGKLGSRPEHERMVINPDEETDLEGYRPFGLSGFIFTKPSYRLDACAHVEWAAYLTAESRVEWHKQAISVNAGWGAVYGDTDSLFSIERRERNVVSTDELGKWKDEGEFINFVGIAPKVYRFERKGEVKVRAKGLRLPRMTQEVDGKSVYFEPGAKQADHMVRNGELVAGDAILGFRKGAKKGQFFKKDTVGRHVSQGFGDRILEPGAEVTRAPTIQESQDSGIIESAA